MSTQHSGLFHKNGLLSEHEKIGVQNEAKVFQILDETTSFYFINQQFYYIKRPFIA